MQKIEKVDFDYVRSVRFTFAELFAIRYALRLSIASQWNQYRLLQKCSASPVVLDIFRRDLHNSLCSLRKFL